MIGYSNPGAELRQNDLIPDAIIECNGRKIFIEIIVTNPINHIKCLKYKDRKSTVLTIDLSEEDRDLDEESLNYTLLKEETNKKILSYYAQLNDNTLIREPAFTLPKWLIPIGLLSIAGMYVFKKFLPGLLKSKHFQKTTRNYRKSYKHPNRAN